MNQPGAFYRLTAKFIAIQKLTNLRILINMATTSYMGKIHWVPEIGDPTLMGWITVIIYFFVALICLKATVVSTNDKSTKKFWIFLTIFLVFLGINKQLDLQTLFTVIGKNLAIEQGWYKDRRIIQVGFIILIGLMGTIGLFYLFKKYKNTASEIKIALTGCMILFSFILIRASSFHHMDIFINFKIMGVKMNWFLELGGLTIIGVGILKYIHTNKT